MGKIEARLIELYQTLPARSLRTLLDHTTVERDSNGAPVAGENELARAREVLTCWLRQAESELGIGGEETPQNEIHRVQAMIGTCPECDQNDGIVIVNGERWVVCHTHFTRWKRADSYLDFHQGKGFSVVTAKQPGVLRYSEIEHHHAECLQESKWELFKMEVDFAVHHPLLWAISLPIDIYRALFRRHNVGARA